MFLNGNIFKGPLLSGDHYFREGRYFRGLTLLSGRHYFRGGGVTFGILREGRFCKGKTLNGNMFPLQNLPHSLLLRHDSTETASYAGYQYIRCDSQRNCINVTPFKGGQQIKKFWMDFNLCIPASTPRLCIHEDGFRILRLVYWILKVQHNIKLLHKEMQWQCSSVPFSSRVIHTVKSSENARNIKLHLENFTYTRVLFKVFTL